MPAFAEEGAKLHGKISPALGKRFHMPRLDWLSPQKRRTRRIVVRPRSLAEVLEPRSLLSATFGADDGSGDTEVAASPYFSETELREYLLNLAQQQFGGLFGQTIPQYEYGYGSPWLEDVVYAMDATPMARTATSNSITSDTNTQVDGVDEADYVETDGRYLYVARGSGLTILDTRGEDGLTVVSEIELDGNVVGMFLFGDRLTVITESGFGGVWYGGPISRVADFVGGEFAPWQWNPQTIVTVFGMATLIEPGGDGSGRTAPEVVDQLRLDSSFRDARAVDGIVYVVLENQFNLPEPLFTDAPPTKEQLAATEDDFNNEEVVDSGDGELKLAVMPSRWGWWNPKITANRTYESFDDYVARVGDQIVSSAMPRGHTVTLEDISFEPTFASPSSIVRPQSDDAQTLLTVLSFDSNQANRVDEIAWSDCVSLLTSPGSTVYMTADALYVATAEYQYAESYLPHALGDPSSRILVSTNTRIDRLSVDGTNVTWQASGVIPGTLINQFAMDEHDGYLHVAAHTSSLEFVPTDPRLYPYIFAIADPFTGMIGSWKVKNDNGVYVLDTDGNTLDEVGSVTGLAPGEQLFAARFIGDTAYLVTFLRVDPLFVVDLSDPENPTVQGELEIPGFSNYLQPVGNGQLIGLGQERVPGTWFTQLQVSLFDVTDGSSPQQLAREYLGGETGWGWSEAQYDHHALLYSSEDGLLVLPFASSGSDADGNWFYEQSLAVLHVDSVNGIELFGKIQTGEPIIRTVRIDNVL
ncbi:MAG: beta-propeller domain-containing protein, partial [Planctomycetaceae bacterium]|nr:beta-propeller domain-containing protein [Planctomycetaceae bacterium]